MVKSLLKRFLLDNIFIKIISLIFAIILWFYVSPKGVEEMDLLIPLKIRNIPASLEIRKGAIDLIGLRISGRKRTLREIAQDKIMASFDLSNGKAGENIIRPTKENINLPSEAKVIRINPERIILQLEPKSEK